jgi:FtsK/SpoIIIE family
MRRGLVPGKHRLERILQWTWTNRVEVGIAYGLWFLWVKLAELMPAPLALVVMLGAASGVYMCAPVRDAIWHWYSWSRCRRRFMMACRHAGVMNGYEQVPKPVSMQEIPVGDLLRVKMAPGIHAGDLGEGCEALAAALAVREIRVVRDRGNAAYADVTLVRENPFADSAPFAWPLLDAPAVSLWKPIPVGVAEDGSEATVLLPERNLLLGGEPGGGKSVALQQVMAAAALHPGVHLTLFDAKRVELTSWRGCADRFVGPDVNDGIAALEELRDDMDERYLWLEGQHRRQIRQGDPFGLVVVGIDELALFTARGEKKACGQFSMLAEDLVARGRAAGIIVVAATQRPSHDIIPTSLRDLFAFRWAMRCSTPEASDTILGRGWASQGFSAMNIDAAEAGVGFLLHEGGLPIRLRSYYLADEHLEAIAARAEALRRQVNGQGVPETERV